MKRVTIGVVIGIVFAAALFSATGVLAQLETRTSTAGGVTLKVTPKVVASDAAAWEFAVVLDTHTQDISDDLSKVASILDANGARRSPTSWQGDGPGGHHREGVLRFEPLRPRPAVIELQVERPGESTPRSFRWELK